MGGKKMCICVTVELESLMHHQSERLTMDRERADAWGRRRRTRDRQPGYDGGNERVGVDAAADAGEREREGGEMAQVRRGTGDTSTSEIVRRS